MNLSTLLAHLNNLPCDRTAEVVIASLPTDSLERSVSRIAIIYPEDSPTPQVYLG